MPEGTLNFAGVGRTTFPSVKEAARLKAVLLLHGELPKDETGVATVTIRTLLGKFVPACDKLLVEYVCAFGAHGLQVLDRYIQHLPDLERNDTLYAEETDRLLNEFRSSL